MFAVVPTELLLKIARQVDVVSRFALGATCKAAIPLVVNAAVFEFRLSKKISDTLLSLCCQPLENRCFIELANCRSSTKAVSTAVPSARKKGHVMPLYEALDPDSERGRLCDEEYCEDSGSLDVCGTVSLRPGSVVASNGQEINRHMLPVGIRPSTTSFALSEAFLSALPVGAPPLSRKQIPRVSCKTSLVILDLSRAQQVNSLSAAGLTSLRVARLPPSLRVAGFEACTALTELIPTCGCSLLLSLRLDGCRKLTGASFRDEVWALDRCEELDLCWCTCIDAQVLTSLLPGASSLRSLSARGLHLPGVLEALLSHDSCLPSLTTLDVGFCSGLTSHAVDAFARSRPALLRCNLRAAATLSAEIYNATGQLMLERARSAASAVGDVVENRRRPKRLEQRAAEPFYYLKRSRR